MLDHHIEIGRFRKRTGDPAGFPVPVEHMLHQVGVAISFIEGPSPYAAELRRQNEHLLLHVYGINAQTEDLAVQRFCMARIYAMSLVNPDQNQWMLPKPGLVLNTQWPEEIFSYRFAADLLLPISLLTAYARTSEFAQSNQPLRMIAQRFEVPYAIAVRQGQRIVQNKLLLSAPIQ